METIKEKHPRPFLKFSYMSVYVDTLLHFGWSKGPSCHMIADTLDELHVMADKIGLKRSWFQNKPTELCPHYDLVASKRKLAVQNGATELERKEYCTKMREVNPEHPYYKNK